jgi:hypothetical protein
VYHIGVNTTNAIETTAADFCNGSLADDKARLSAAIAGGDKLQIELLIEALACEASTALQQIVMNAPDEPNELEYGDFIGYYREMAEEIESVAIG